MTQAEARRVVAYLNAVFPRESIEPETFAVWVGDLMELGDGDLALEVARGIGRTADRFPTLASFRAEYRIARQQRSDARGLPQPEFEAAPPPPEAAEMLERLRSGTVLRDM